MKKTISHWCVKHKKYHGMKFEDCDILPNTRQLLGESFVRWMESRGVRFTDVYPVSMAKKKGKE